MIVTIDPDNSLPLVDLQDYETTIKIASLSDAFAHFVYMNFVTTGRETEFLEEWTEEEHYDADQCTIFLSNISGVDDVAKAQRAMWSLILSDLFASVAGRVDKDSLPPFKDILPHFMPPEMCNSETLEFLGKYQMNALGWVVNQTLDKKLH